MTLLKDLSIELTQSVTLEHYPEIPAHLVEDVWFEVDPDNYHGLVNPHETRDFYAERIQAYRQARDGQAERIAEPIPNIQEVLAGEDFHDPESIRHQAARYLRHDLFAMA